MSGVCSAHRAYSRGCPQCNAGTDPVDDHYEPLTLEERAAGIRGEYPLFAKMLGWIRRWEATVRALEPGGATMTSITGVGSIERYVKGEEFWHPLNEDGRSYPSHRFDDRAILEGLKTGVTIAVFPPKDDGHDTSEA